MCVCVCICFLGLPLRLARLLSTVPLGPENMPSSYQRRKRKHRLAEETRARIQSEVLNHCSDSDEVPEVSQPTHPGIWIKTKAIEKRVAFLQAMIQQHIPVLCMHPFLWKWAPQFGTRKRTWETQCQTFRLALKIWAAYLVQRYGRSGMLLDGVRRRDSIESVLLGSMIHL